MAQILLNSQDQNYLGISMIIIIGLSFIALLGYVFHVMRTNYEKKNDITFQNLLKNSEKTLPPQNGKNELDKTSADLQKQMEKNPEKFKISVLATHRNLHDTTNTLAKYFVKKIFENENPKKVYVDLFNVGLTIHTKYEKDSLETRMIELFKIIIEENFLSVENRQKFFDWKKNFSDINPEIWKQIYNETYLGESLPMPDNQELEYITFADIPPFSTAN